MWISITNLMSLQMPLPCKTMLPNNILQDQFTFNLSKVTAIYSRQIIEQFVKEKRAMPIEDIKIEELISWAVWDQFGHDAVTGWMHDLSPVLTLNN